MKRLALFFSFIIIFNFCFSQSKTEILVYNVGLNAVIGGIGSVIHKKKDETICQAFLNGGWKGTIGGVFTYTGKELVGLIPEKNNYWYGLEGKMIHSLGTSITYNAMMNKGIFDSYRVNFGFINLSTDFKKVNLKINPITFLTFSYLLIKNENKLNIEKSIKTGTIFFEFKESKSYLGQTQMNIIRVKSIDYDFIESFPDKKEEEVLKYQIYEKQCIASHELIHTLQFEEYLNINNFIPINIKYINNDLPLSDLLYMMFKYENNPFEKEANYYH